MAVFRFPAGEVGLVLLGQKPKKYTECAPVVLDGDIGILDMAYLTRLLARIVRTLWEYILKAELSFLRTMASFLRTMATNEITHGAYFCLDNVGDEEGNLPVRDCSCRGDSAGFAHLSCLAKYAEQKCKEGLKDDGDTGLAFCKPWNFCNTCKQPFQNQLAVDLASAFVSFTEATYGQ